MDRWQYLIVLGACLLVTAPLEIFGEGVYRQARRAAFAILPVAAVFVVWDAVAIAGIELPAAIPLEELLFFIVIPLCGLFTYNAVDTILTYLRKRSHARSEQSS